MQPEVGEGKFDPDVQLQKGIAHVNEFNADADLVVFCGDLTHTGDEASYEMLRKRLEDLDIPYKLMMGNHDIRENFVSVFGDAQLDKNGFLQQVVDGPCVKLILLDTLNGPPYNYPYSHQGLLCEERLSWLDEELKQSGDKPCIIFMHHPAHKTGFVAMDTIRLMDGERFYEVVKRNGNVRHIVCGHVHRTIFIWRSMNLRHMGSYRSAMILFWFKLKILNYPTCVV
jgi:3',5'-cyclic AMP phosphodiesterase CpdA